MSLQDPLIVDVEKDQKAAPEGHHSPISRGLVSLFFLFIGGSFLYFLIYTISNTYDYIGPPQASLPTCGTVQGLWIGGERPGNPPAAKFLGIPYGAPPVEWNRWQPAKPASCWTDFDVYPADYPGQICYQYGSAWSNFPTSNQSEDCLNLNVWTKNLDNAYSNDSTKLMPTLFWIYGGSNVFGSVDSYYGVQNWLYNGDVCVVAPNFRLNIFGFLATEELSANDTRGASGNYAITDIQEALRWVQNNIRAFGCDPNRVTVFGQSSGATNVFALMSSPASNGLFHHAIALSGSNNITMDLATAEAQNRDVVQNLGCDLQTSDAVLQCLHNASPEKLISAIPPSWEPLNFWPSDPNGLNFKGLTIVDGVTVTTSWVEAAQNGTVQVDLILQSVRDELEFFYLLYDQEVLQGDSEFYKAYLEANFSNWPYGPNTGDYIYNIYSEVADQSVERAYFDFQADLQNLCAHRVVGSAYAQAVPNKNVYIFAVEQPPAEPYPASPGAPPCPDPFHTWDWVAATGAFDFYLQLNDGAVGSYSPKDSDLAFGNNLRNQYYEFIATGAVSAAQPVNSSVTTIVVQGSESKDAAIHNNPDYHLDNCNKLKNAFFEDDSRFWWVN